MINNLFKTLATSVEVNIVELEKALKDFKSDLTTVLESKSMSQLQNVKS